MEVTADETVVNEYHVPDMHFDQAHHPQNINSYFDHTHQHSRSKESENELWGERIDILWIAALKRFTTGWVCPICLTNLHQVLLIDYFRNIFFGATCQRIPENFLWIGWNFSFSGKPWAYFWGRCRCFSDCVLLRPGFRLLSGLPACHSYRYLPRIKIKRVY